MWNNVKDNPSASKMFYDIVQVMECLKQQMLFNEGKPLGYDHEGDGNVFMYSTTQKDKDGIEVFDGDIVQIGGSIEVVRYINGVLTSCNESIYGKI